MFEGTADRRTGTLDLDSVYPWLSLGPQHGRNQNQGCNSPQGRAPSVGGVVCGPYGDSGQAALSDAESTDHRCSAQN